MHDTNDIRKSKELHDKEINSELIAVLKRIAKALEYIEHGIIQTRGEY